MDAEIRLTRVRKKGGALLCKRISADEHGRPVSDGSPCAMATGTAKRVRLNGSPAANLAELMTDLGTHEAIILGDIADEQSDRINLEKDDAADPARGTFGRTRKTFIFRANKPAPALLDFDQKAMPADVRERLSDVGSFEGALAALIPGYAQLARVLRASTSAGIRNQETGEQFPGSGGVHAYVFVRDGSDIPRFLDTLQKRAWLAGYGWIMVGARGQLLLRSIVDSSVGSPERLVFEGPPLVMAPLAQDHAARQPVAHEGELLDTRAACPSLTAEEQRRFDALVAAAKLAAKPEAEAAVETAAQKIAQDRGIDLSEARAVIQTSLRGVLTSHDRLEFDDDGIGVVSVADVLADPDRFHKKTLADPIEGRSYGRAKAKVYRNTSGAIVVNSFAHGGATYRLNHDAAYIEARLNEAGEGAPFVLAALMTHAQVLDAVTRERLRNLAAKLGKVSKRAVNATVAEELSKAKREASDRPPPERDHVVEPEPSPEQASAQPEPEPAEDWEQALAAKVAELNETYFVVSVGGSVRIARIVYDTALGRDRLVFMRDTDIRLRFSHIHLKVGVTQRNLDIVKGLGDAWLNHHQRRTYDRMELITSGPCPAEVYNLWRGYGVQPVAGSWVTIEAHLRVVVCSDNDAHYKWLIGWLAYCVQHPGRQAEVAVVLRGLKGTGKGLVGQMLMRIFLGHSLHITNSKHLVGHFNAHLLDALFLFLDEAFWGGDKQGEGTLKALITERTTMIEPKGVDPFPMPNRLKILMASNNDWVVPASADERRYFVLDVPETRKGDKAYFTALAAAIEGNELAALLDYLLKLDLSAFDHRNPPHTDGLNKQKIIGADSLEKFWMDCLTSGTIVNAEIDDDWPATVRCADLHSAYTEHAHAHGDRHPLTLQQMAVRLRTFCPGGFLKVVRPRTADGGEIRPRHFALQHIDQHREAFLDAMSIETHEWPTLESAS